jgi:hypothetical protein
MLFKSILKAAPLVLAAMSPRLMCKDESRHQVFMWGNGVYQARPDALLQFQNFTPKRMTNLPPGLVQLELGEYFEAGIDSEGALFVWNTQKTDANLEVGETKDSERKNIQKLAKGVRDVKFTTGYIWTLTGKNEVVQYPIVKEFGEGREVVKTTLGKPRTVDPLKGAKQICSGCKTNLI